MLFIYLKQKHLNFVPTEGRDVTSLEHMPISLDCKCCPKGHSCLVTWKWRKWTVLDCILLCLGCEIVHYCSFEVVVHCSCGWFYDSKNIKLFARMYWRQWLICLCSWLQMLAWCVLQCRLHCILAVNYTLMKTVSKACTCL